MENKKDKILVLGTHGNFGQELLQSAQMIIGKMTNVCCFALTEEMSPTDYASHIIQSLGDCDVEIICLVDLFGGTPCNVFRMLQGKYNITIATGVNLPMVMEAYSSLNRLDIDALMDFIEQTYKLSYSKI